MAFLIFHFAELFSFSALFIIVSMAKFVRFLYVHQVEKSMLSVKSEKLLNDCANFEKKIISCVIFQVCAFGIA